MFEKLEAYRADYAVVARLTPSLKRLLPGLRYAPANPWWECAEGEFRAHGWKRARRLVVACRAIEEDDPQPTLFAMESRKAVGHLPGAGALSAPHVYRRRPLR